MRAVVFQKENVVIAGRADPTPGTGEVLVKVRAAGLNGADLLQRRGRYPAPPGSPPDIPGLEFAGEVVGLGEDASRFKIGDRVMAIVGGGAQAELIAVHERQAMPVPEQLDWISAGGFPEVFSTAYDALFTQADLQMGERLLVNGGAGGVGTAAVQLARLAGVEVVATVRSEQLHSRVAALGAHVVAPGAENLAELGPFDVVLELVGAENLMPSLKSLTIGGRIVVIGVGAGAKTEINLLALMDRRARLSGSTLRARPLEEKAAVARALERHVLPLVRRNEIEIPVEESFALADAESAYERFAAGGKFGKIVLAAGVKE